MSNTILTLIIGGMLMSGFAAQAEAPYRVSRYAVMEPVATAEQADVLSVVVSLDFPDPITTVGGAIEHLLLRSGYRMADPWASDPALPRLWRLPLPLVHRHLGPIRIDNALSTLAGPAWDLVVDPVNRLISFDLQDQYRSRLPQDALL